MKPLLWLRRPDYFANRFGVWWWEKTHPRDPWFAKTMVEILDDWLKPTDVGIEFGAGRSTQWLARRMAHLTSIELHPVWRDIVQKQLEEAGVASKVDLRYFPAGGDKWKKDKANSPYVRSVDDIPDGSVDFVLVDGWAREHCAMVAMRKLKPGGILVFDDIHAHAPLRPSRAKRGKRPPLIRPEGFYHPPYFAEVMEALRDWRCIWTGNGKQDTALWMKPVS